MNILLLAFALPVATVLLAIVLQKVLKCPLLVAATFFAILLIITYAVFDSSFLVFAILYTILAYVTAVLTRLVCNIISRFGLSCGENCICENTCTNVGRSVAVSNGSWCCTTRNNGRTGIGTASANTVLSNGNGNGCGCNQQSSEQNDPVIILTNTNDMRNRNSSGRNGCGCGCNR